MPKFNGFSKKVQADLEQLRTAAKGRILGYVTAGLGFVAGLAWNEAITSLINEAFPSVRNTILAKFIYAGVITFVVAGVAIYVERLLRGGNSGKP